MASNPLNGLSDLESMYESESKDAEYKTPIPPMVAIAQKYYKNNDSKSMHNGV